MRIISTLIATLLISTAYAFSPGDFAGSYQITPAGSGTDGNPLVKVTFEVKKPSDYSDKAMRNAVHGLLFYGYEAANNCPKQSPIYKSDEEKDVTGAYFKAFFDDERYKKFIVSVADNNVEIIKAKKGYRVGVIVCVDKRHLRKELEESNIIRKLGEAVR